MEKRTQGTMDSLNIYFVDKNRVECCSEPVLGIHPGGVLVRAQSSLISTGTELICLGRLFASDTRWDRWVI